MLCYRVTTMHRIPSYLAAGALAAASLCAQPAGTPAGEIARQFASVNQRVLEMAKDFPATKYDYRLRPEMRSFGAVLVHIASGNVFAAKAGGAAHLDWNQWTELDPANYKTKEATVALLEKSIADATATLKSLPAERFHSSLQPWIAVIEHAGEHYGLLVAYYRANGIVPPASRKK